MAIEETIVAITDTSIVSVTTKITDITMHNIYVVAGKDKTIFPFSKGRGFTTDMWYCVALPQVRKWT